jgi:hypothetical protein
MSTQFFCSKKSHEVFIGYKISWTTIDLNLIYSYLGLSILGNILRQLPIRYQLYLPK